LSEKHQIGRKKPFSRTTVALTSPCFVGVIKLKKEGYLQISLKNKPNGGIIWMF